MLWLTYLERVRGAKAGGYSYIDAPSNGAYHCHPTENWRFYPGVGLAVAAWAASQGRDVRLLESFIAARGPDGWSDCVMVFRKGADAAVDGRGRLVACFPDSYNVRIDGSPAVANRSEAMEDMLLLARAAQEIAGGETAVAQLQQRNAALEQGLAELRDENHTLRAAADRCAARLLAIEESTAWRATARLRSAAATLPVPVRRALRRLARAGFWAVTPHRVASRLGFLRKRRRQARGSQS